MNNPTMTEIIAAGEQGLPCAFCCADNESFRHGGYFTHGWECGSRIYATGGHYQHDRCRVAQLKRENERLMKELATARKLLSQLEITPREQGMRGKFTGVCLLVDGTPVAGIYAGSSYGNGVQKIAEAFWQFGEQVRAVLGEQKPSTGGIASSRLVSIAADAYMHARSFAVTVRVDDAQPVDGARVDGLLSVVATA